MKHKLFTVSVLALLFLSMFGGLGVWQIKPAHATPIFSDGFETGDFTAWTSQTANAPDAIAVSTLAVHTGLWGARATITLSTSYAYTRKNIADTVTTFARAYFRVGTSLPTNNLYYRILELRHGGDDFVQVRISNIDGSIYWTFYSPDQTNDVAATINVDQWYCVEIKAVANSALGGEVRLYINGVDILDRLNFDTSGTPHVDNLRVGENYHNGDVDHLIDVDCVVVDSIYIGIEGTGLTEGDEVASNWTYRISQNTTSCYLINSTGAIWDNNSDPAVMINNALWNCSNAGIGSIYVYPDTYLTDEFIGGNPLYNNWFSNITLQLGDGTIIQRTGGSYEYDAMFRLQLEWNNKSSGDLNHGVHNFTLTSNGTAYLNAAGYADGMELKQLYNCTISNIVLQHLSSSGIQISRSMYNTFENVSIFSYGEHYPAGSLLNLGDVQYSTFTHLDLDGNYEQGYSQEGVLIHDWEGGWGTDWDGSYFNSFSDVWVHNMKKNGFYLNSGGTGYGVYNNTFDNCTVQNTWQDGYFAVKLRPSQNNTFTNMFAINCSGGVTTGTSYDESEVAGNCTGNYVQMEIINCTSQPFTLTTDGSNQSVDHNFFNLTITGGFGQTYFVNGVSSPIHDNVAYVNFTNCHGGIYLEQGNITQNVFYLNFSGVTDHPDICHWSGWSHITDNTFNVYATSGNPNGLMDFTNGTQRNFVFYPYVSGAPPSVSVFIVFPTNTTYTSSTVSVELYASGGTIDTILWNCTFTNGTIAYANTVYTIATSMSLVNGSYIFNAYANNTLGEWDEATVLFTVLITPLPPPPSGERKTTIWVEPEYVNTTGQADMFISWCLDHYINQIAIHGEISDIDRAYLTSYGFAVFQTTVCTLDPPTDYNYTDYMNTILSTYTNYSGIIFNDGQTLWDKARAANLSHEEALENYQSFITYAEQILTPHYGIDNVINIACIFSDSIDYALMPQINATQSVFTYYYPPDPTIRYFSNYTWFNTTASGWDVKSFYDEYAPANHYQYEGWMLIYVPNIPTNSILKTFNGILDLEVSNIEIFQYSSIANDTKYSRLLKYLCQMWTEGVTNPILSDAVYIYNWTETYWQEPFDALPANQTSVTYEGWQFTQNNANFTYAVSNGHFVLFWNGSRSEAGYGNFLMQRAFTTELGLNMSVEFMPIADMISKSIIITEGEAFDSLQAYRFGFSAFTYDMNFIFFNVSRQETTIGLGKWTPYSSYTIQFNIDMEGCSVQIQNSTWTWNYTIPSSEFRYNSLNTRTLLVQGTIGNLTATNATVWTMDFANAIRLTTWNPPYEFSGYVGYYPPGGSYLGSGESGTLYMFVEDGLIYEFKNEYRSNVISLYGKNATKFILACSMPENVTGDVLSYEYLPNELSITYVSGPMATIRLLWPVPWLLPYMFIFGMIGMVSSFVGPLYAIYKVKHGDYYDGLRMGVILTAIGMSLVIAWLWV